MGLGSKALVVFIGVPLYLFSDLLPRELANLVSLTWHQLVKPLIDMGVDMIVSGCRFLYNRMLLPFYEWAIDIVCTLFDAARRALQRIATFLVDAISVVIRLIDNAFLVIWQRVLLPVARFLRDFVVIPLWRALCDVIVAIKDLVERFVRYVMDMWSALVQWCWDNIVTPLVNDLRRFIEWTATTLWDYVVVPLWRTLRWIVVDVVGAALRKLYDIVSNLHMILWHHVIQPTLDFLYVVWVTARDIVLWVWQPVRDWLVNKFYQLCSLVQSLAASLWHIVVTVWSLLSHCADTYIYAPLAVLAQSVYQLAGDAVLAARDYCYTVGAMAYETIDVARDFVVSLFVRSNK